MVRSALNQLTEVQNVSEIGDIVRGSVSDQESDAPKSTARICAQFESLSDSNSQKALNPILATNRNS